MACCPCMGSPPILVCMKAILLILLAVAVAQTGGGPPEVIPIKDQPGLETYVITLDEEGELHGAFQMTATQITIHVDAPWLENPPERRTLRSKVRGEPHEELPQRRYERRIRQAREAGYTFVETPAGAFFVLQDTKRHADRAVSMAKEASATAPAPVPASMAPGASLDAVLSDGASAGVGHYAWYLAILGTGLLLLGIVVRRLILAP